MVFYGETSLITVKIQTAIPSQFFTISLLLLPKFLSQNLKIRLKPICKHESGL